MTWLTPVLTTNAPKLSASSVSYVPPCTVTLTFPRKSPTSRDARFELPFAWRASQEVIPCLSISPTRSPILHWGNGVAYYEPGMTCNKDVGPFAF